MKLVRALIETGGLSVSAAKKVLATLDANPVSLACTFEAAQRTLGAGSTSDMPASPESRRRITDLAAGHHWRIAAQNPGVELAARALDGFAAVGHEPSNDYLNAYTAAAATIARADMAALSVRSGADAIAELMVIGTVLGDGLVAGLRRLAQENETATLFPSTADGTAGDPVGTSGRASPDAR